MEALLNTLRDPLAVQTMIIGGTGLVCGLVLSAAARFFAVHEDPRIEQLTALLPGINCGGCGYAGCAEYARAMLLDGAPANLCKPGGAATLEKVASFLGVEATVTERQVALVLCGGHDGVARRAALYNGLADCAAAQQLGGNGKACRFGCLGLGSCARACPVGAIELQNSLAVVHPELCIGCGACARACPRRLIKLVPESRVIHVLCVNPDRGPEVKKVCAVGCIGCSLCVKACGGQGITMRGALAVVDYSVPLDNAEVVAKCPQRTIVRRSGVREPHT